ncbi:hypothetical protein IE53DRAFT_367211 [Violaceomyces palustris]|uniref:Uncharacterized protein n=1 Tax=Violaceomyces palustris TaxID=1673888 RepID=A0ACD0P316_9BASI|nr:hypothetical protein IE53DRAFT_367211 [Violaceomyces palustris]
MSSPGQQSNTAPSAASSAGPALARSRKSSTTSLGSMPARLVQPPTLKPPSANVKLDLSSASAEDHPSSLTGVRPKAKAGPPTVSSSTGNHPIASSEVWRSSAAKRAEKAWAIQSEKALQSDSKFKKYTSMVERTLATFDSVSEWADFISFLSRLLKAFQAFPQFNVIPRKLIVAKRLSQCLNPALPSGVHQRALDVYIHILSVIGSDGLRRDLQIWTPGILPFFQFASTSVKPTLLTIFEKHYLPLHEDLRPVMKALLLALLPGLEEETGEFFDRVLTLLDNVCRSVGRPFFLQNIWLVLITTPATRLAALNFLTRRMPRLNDEVDPQSVVGKDLGLMVRGFAHALEDETLLVRRSALDLLVTHMRMDKPTFCKFIKQTDRVLLVRSALAVVLRRDLSLNRRLYSWLLGAAEGIEGQQSYLQKHGLNLVRLALKEDFYADEQAVDASDRQRPYKIFISLLDKWEIGQPLTRVLILDAFQALSRHITGQNPDDLLTTGRMLFEVIDPFVCYRQFFLAIKRQLVGNDASEPGHGQEESYPPDSAIQLLCFVLKTFRVHDEESRQIHLPLLFSSLVEMLEIQAQRSGLDDALLDAGLILDALELGNLILLNIPASVFVSVAPTEDAVTRSPIVDFLQHAAAFYESDESNTAEAAERFLGFHDHLTSLDLLSKSSTLSLKFADAIKRAEMNREKTERRDIFVRTLKMFSDLLGTLERAEDPTVSSLVRSSNLASVKVPWNPEPWAHQLLAHLREAPIFAEVERIIDALLSSSSCKALQAPLRIDSHEIMEATLVKLLHYLEPQRSPYHARAVDLIWGIERQCMSGKVETILCRQLTVGDFTQRARAADAFGALWRLSEESLIDVLHAPMLIIVDKLRSSDGDERQLAESWLRSSLKSYTRLVDSLFVHLLDPSVARRSVVLACGSIKIDAQEYTKPFDQEQVNYTLSVILSLAKFGGQGFTRALKTSGMGKTSNISLAELIDQGVISTQSSYLDVLLDAVTVFLQSEPEPGLTSHMAKANAATHSLAIDLLQTIVPRGSLDAARLRQLESLLVESVLLSIASAKLERQNKMLHALHSVIHAQATSSAPINGLERRMPSTSLHGDGREEGFSAEIPPISKPTSKTIAPHPLLLEMIRRGLATQSNRPVLQHWADFVLMTISYYRKNVTSLLLPINECVCSLLQQSLEEIDASYALPLSRPSLGASTLLQATDAACLTSDSDLTLLINVSERVLLQALGEDPQVSRATRDESVSGQSSTEKSLASTADGSGGLLGYVSNVFAPDTPTIPGPSPLALSERSQNLHLAVRTLHSAWAMSEKAGSERDAKTLMLENLTSKVKLRCRRAFERIYRAHSGEVVEYLVDCWLKSRDGSTDLAGRGSQAAFEVLDFVAPSAQIVVTFLCDVISTRTSPSSDRGKRLPAAICVPEGGLFFFLDAYLARMEAPLAVQVWPVIIMMVKDFVTNSSSHKLHIFPVLKVLTTVGEKLCQTTALEDKRIKRDLQENYAKLADFCILISGRSFDQTTWIRRSGKDNTDALEAEAAYDGDEKAAGLPAESSGKSLIDSINEFLAERCLTGLRKFGVDPDKINTICSNAIYYIVAPAFKSKSKSLEIDPYCLSVLAEMTRLPGTLKAWRTTVADAFLDPRFFTISPASSKTWGPIVYSLMAADKEKLSELIGKITAASSANIFTNREAEMLARAFNLRRLSFVIYSGDKDHFLPQLPNIQEKVVDILRTNVAELVHAEVYLCMRVLLCRFSGRHLASFWPVIITELMRLFENLVEDLPSDNSDGLHLVLSACKFLDLLLTTQSEDFQIHQWMFVTDTVDVAHPPDDWMAESIMDRLAVIINEKRTALTPSMEHGLKVHKVSDPFDFQESDDHATLAGTDTTSSLLVNGHKVGGVSKRSKSKKLRRPMLSMREVKGIEQLLEFFSSVSINSYESLYSCDEVDWEVVEESLVNDMFEGV